MEKAEVVEFLCRVVGDIVENETGRRPAVAETSNLWGQNGLLSSLMLVELMLAFTVPAQDPRYILPAIECAVLFVSIVLAKAVNGKKRCMAHG